jgi:hypothetical protein
MLTQWQAWPSTCMQGVQQDLQAQGWGKAQGLNGKQMETILQTVEECLIVLPEVNMEWLWSSFYMSSWSGLLVVCAPPGWR